jgi:hypothetical protein
MMEWLKGVWEDSVWSKVIGGLIVAAILSFFALLNSGVRAWFKKRMLPNVTVTQIRVSDQPGKMYPIKIYIELRNDFRKCIEVSLSKYEPKAVTLKRFVPTTLQLSFSSWVPELEGVDRVALLPGQLCRAWVAADESKFTAEQVEGLLGNIGAFGLKVNGKEFTVQL